MRCGVSTSCFYPLQTEEALKQAALTGAPCTEVFFNTFGEIEPEYISRLKFISQEYSLPVVSVHPFSSNMEPFFFATDYYGRLQDGIQLYKKLFAAAQSLGAHIAVMHGDYRESFYEFKDYCKNYKTLQNIARQYGVHLCQENVVRCCCATDTAVSRMRDILNDEAEFVLDTKQALRAGIRPEDMLKAMNGRLAHIHISDYSDEHDCVLPGKGKMNYTAFFNRLKQCGYNADMVIELYRTGFEIPVQLEESIKLLNRLAGRE